VLNFAPFFDRTRIPNAVIKNKAKIFKKQCIELYLASHLPQLVTSLCSNSAARGQIAFKLHKMVLCGSMRNCQNSPRVEYKMANDAQIFNIRDPISLERLNLVSSNLVRASTTRKKLGQRERDPV